MKNWKKWAAGICALSLCMTAVSLPAAAEGEDDIALISDTSEDMPVADGTDGGDASSELCNEKRHDKIRIGAERKSHMCGDGRCGGDEES